MPKFRKKPVEIDAIRFTEATRDEIIAWTDCRHRNIDDDGCDYETAHLFIRTLEGEMMATQGDWIIKGVKGEFYPCKPDIFAATYERVLSDEERLDLDGRAQSSAEQSA